MNVCVPHELYRTPRLRQAAGTLHASGESAVDGNGGRNSVDNTKSMRTLTNFDNILIQRNVDVLNAMAFYYEFLKKMQNFLSIIIKLLYLHRKKI